MILRRYIVRSLLGPFLLGFGIITFLLTTDMLLDLLDLIIGKGISAWTVARLFLLALGWIVALSVPCGVLVAALMTYGRMSQDNEIIALRASGVHLLQILAPTLVLSAIVAAALTLFNNYILPETNYAYASLLQEISRQRPTAEIREGVLISDFKGYHLWISRLDDRSGEMQDVLILDGTSNRQSPRTILASSGTLRFDPEANALTLELHDGEIHEADPESKEGEYRVLGFETQELNIADGAELWRQTVERRRSQREMSIPAMKMEIQKLIQEEDRQLVLIRDDLSQLRLSSLEELDRLEPSSKSARGWAPILALAGKLLGAAPRDTSAAWTAEEQRVVELIRSRERELRMIERKVNEYRVEVHKKFSIPVACVVFVLVGAPLGMWARRGGFAVAFFSAIFFIFYYLCLIGGEQLADRLLLSPWLAMWLPNLVLGGVGVYMTARAVVSGQPARPRRGGAGA